MRSSWFKKEYIGCAAGSDPDPPYPLFVGLLSKVLTSQQDLVLYHDSRMGYPTKDLEKFIVEELKFKKTIEGRNCITYVGDSGYVFLNKKVHGGGTHGGIYTFGKKDFDLFMGFIREHLKPREPKGKVKILTSSPHGLEITDLGDINSPFLHTNYPKSVSNGYQYVQSELSKQTPNGRIVLLNGPPGTGKSFFIRSLISSVPASFIYIPANVVGEISGPNLIGVIRDYEEKRNWPIVLILEDADTSLIKREAGNYNKLSEFLNISDGLLGELVNLRLVATTNSGRKDFDPAILRPGRLCANVEFPLLTSKEAAMVFLRLTQKKREFSKDVSLAEVYALAANPDYAEHSFANSEEVGQYV